jgi:chromosome segregation ATPase
MELDEAILGVTKRQAEREFYDAQKTLRLASDEIDRLESELQMTLRQIAELTDGNARAISIYQTRITKLKQEISALATQTSVKKSQLASGHTQQITALQAAHRTALDRTRADYERRLGDVADSSIPEDVESEVLLDSISSTRSKIEDLLQQKSERQELEIQAKLSRLTEQIQSDRARVKELEKSIEQLKADLQSAKALASIQKTEVLLAIPQIDTGAEEEHLAVATADLIASETALREASHVELEGMRKRITEVHLKTAKLKRSIRESDTDQTEPLQRAARELQELEADQKSIMLRTQESEARIPRRVHKETRRQAAIIVQKETLKESLKEASAQNATLLRELRRLDFMIYGRNGRWQPAPSPTRPPFLI